MLDLLIIAAVAALLAILSWVCPVFAPILFGGLALSALATVMVWLLLDKAEGGP